MDFTNEELQKALDDICKDHGLPSIKFDSTDDLHACACCADDPVEVKKLIDEIVNRKNNIKSAISAIDAPHKDDTKEVDAITACSTEMGQISNNINKLIDLEIKQKTMLFKLEELYYHYRTVEIFYTKRNEIFNTTVDALDLLLTEKDNLTKALTTTGNHIIEQNRLIEVNTSIAKYKDTNFAAKENFKFGSYPHSLITLKEKTKELFNLIDNGIDAKMKEFSSRIHIVAIPSGKVSLELKYNKISDDFNLLTDTSFLNDNALVSFVQEETNKTGILYTKLYNILADQDILFSLDERGLSVSGKPDEMLAGTGATSFNGKTISNFKVYSEFFSNFVKHYEDRIQYIKDTVIEPSLASTQSSLEEYATKLILLKLSFVQVYDKAPKGNPDVEALKKEIQQDTKDFLDVINKIKSEIDLLTTKHSATLKAINDEGEKFKKMKCLGKQDNTEIKAPEAGNDPLGITTLENTDTINLPTILTRQYWNKFSLLATAVGILPFLTKYWPVGLIIPSPAGPVKIPLPIIWVPLAVIPTPFGIFVMFIGQCGICPSPFVFFNGGNGDKKFIVSLRPTDKFGADATQPFIKPISKGGVGNSLPGTKVINDGLPKGAEKIEDVDSKKSVLTDLKKTIVSSLNESIIINSEETNKIKSAKGPDEKKAFLEVLKTKIESLDMPDIKLPKDEAKINPKPSFIEKFKGEMDTCKDLGSVNMLLASAGPLIHIQMPSIPSGDIQLQLTIPLSSIKTAMSSGVSNLIDAKKDLSDYFIASKEGLTSTDVKRMCISIIEDSLDAIDSVAGPVIDTISKFKKSKPKTIAETFGLPKVETSDDTIFVDEGLMVKAKKVLNVLSLVPYPAVAAAPQAFENLHPMLNNDDLPPWERLSLSNFLFVGFLDKWISSGKKGGGLLENP
jgi:hypothetical protein